MKRELNSGFGTESEPAGLVDVTETQSLTRELAQPSSHVVKVVNDGDKFEVNKVNGVIVYTRVKKFRSSDSDELLENNVNSQKIKGFQEIKTDVDQSNLVVEDVIDESRVVETVLEENSVVKIVVETSQLVDMVNVSEVNCGLDVPMSKEELISESERKGDCSDGTQFAVSEISSVKNGLRKKAKKWLMQSELKQKGETVEVLVTQSEGFQNGTMSLIEVEPIAEGSALSNPKKNMELKMSKKIVLNKKPMTVTELFETGLLDGVTVVYMGGIKFRASGLRGTIRDGGILCSCSLCNGCRVIPPSKFEIHACKQYRRASQYICFENGKSLLEVLRACRSVPLPMLESTLQSALSSSPEEKSFSCVRCKGTFPITSVGKIGPGPLCNACARSKKTQASETYVTGRIARSSELDLVSNFTPSASVCITSQNKRQRKKSRKLLEADLYLKSSSKSASMSKLLKNKSPWELKRKLSRPGLITKSSISASVHASPLNKHQTKIIKRSRKSMVISNPFQSPLAASSFPDPSQWQITTKDQGLHKLVFEDRGLPDGTDLGYNACGQKLLEGYKNGSAIICCCCNCEVSSSQFEAHAGWASCKKHYAYTSNGVSLHELAMSLSKGCKFPSMYNDDLCIICADGGNLLLCDGCPRAFHKECASLSSIPQGDWYCNYCQSTFGREKVVAHNAKAVAAGRISGIDPIDQIAKRCIQIVKNVEAELSGCVLCRACDFSKSGFGPRTILLCDQCEKEFHVGCLKKHKMADLRELPEGKWFCCIDCSWINSVLQNLLVQEAEKLSDSDLNTVKKKYSEKGVHIDSNIDVRWRLLSGKATTPETRFLLSQAVAIFHDCFDPIVDSLSGRDLIPSMVYGRNLRGQEFGGMYCAVLTVNSSVVSAGILRVFGQEVAELPLVATSKVNHGKGYFQLLFTCIEKLLAFLHVKTIVLPAVKEAESIWTDRFGFKYIDSEKLSMFRKSCSQMVTFKGTSMLQKAVSVCGIVSSTESAECISGVEVE